MYFLILICLAFILYGFLSEASKDVYTYAKRRWGFKGTFLVTLAVFIVQILVLMLFMAQFDRTTFSTV